MGHLLHALSRLREQAIAIATTAPSADRAAEEIRAFGLRAQDVLAGRADVPRELTTLVERCTSGDPLERPVSAWEIVHALDGISMSLGGADPETAAPPTIGTNITAWMLAAIAIFAAIAWFAMR